MFYQTIKALREHRPPPRPRVHRAVSVRLKILTRKYFSFCSVCSVRDCMNTRLPAKSTPACQVGTEWTETDIFSPWIGHCEFLLDHCSRRTLLRGKLANWQHSVMDLVCRRVSHLCWFMAKMVVFLR